MIRNLFLLLVYVLFQSSLHAGGLVKMKEEDGKVFVYLSEKHDEGYLTLEVQSVDRKTSYWELNLNYCDGCKIELGKAPVNTKKAGEKGWHRIQQDYPENGAVPVIPVDTELRLSVIYRKDFLLFPGSGLREIKFKLRQDGALEIIK